jgi:hypothetical protein
MGKKEWRLLINEGNETQHDAWRHGGEQARQFKEGSDAARIVIGAGAARNRIIMRADKEDLPRFRMAGASCLEIGAMNPPDIVSVSRDGVTLALPFAADVVSSGHEGRWPEDIAFADVGRKALDVIADRGCKDRQIDGAPP